MTLKRSLSNLANLMIPGSPKPRKHSPKQGLPPRHPRNNKSKKVEGIAMKGGKKNKTQRNKSQKKN